MKRIFIIVIFLLFFTNFCAEKNINLYKIYLKNKSEYIGKLIELTPNEQIAIQTLDKNIIYFQWAEIKKIESVENKKIISKFDSTFSFKKFKKLHFLLGYFTFFQDELPGDGFSLEIPLIKNDAGYLFIQSGFTDKKNYQAGTFLIGLKLFNPKKPFSIFLSGAAGPVYYDGYIFHYSYCCYSDNYPSDIYHIVRKLYPMLKFNIGVHSTNIFYGFTQFFIGLRLLRYDYYDYDWECIDEYCTDMQLVKVISTKSCPIVIFGFNFGF